jgi:hypothetical protein
LGVSGGYVRPTGQVAEHGRGLPVHPRLRRIRAWSRAVSQGWQ